MHTVYMAPYQHQPPVASTALMLLIGMVVAVTAWIILANQLRRS